MKQDYPKWGGALELVRSTTAGGADTFWWDDLAQGAAKILDVGIENRSDIFERAGRVVRSAYPNQKKVWATPFTEIQLDHILHLIVGEIEFCVEHLPEPKPKVTNKKGEKGTSQQPIAGAPLPPPPATMKPK